MTAALFDPQVAGRLAKLCGMFGSDHPGERANAALQADKLVRSLGLTWSDVIRVSNVSHAIHLPHDWREIAKACRVQAHRLSAREFDFINNIAMARCDPSEKQLKWLQDIFERVRR